MAVFAHFGQGDFNDVFGGFHEFYCLKGFGFSDRCVEIVAVRADKLMFPVYDHLWGVDAACL